MRWRVPTGVVVACLALLLVPACLAADLSDTPSVDNGIDTGKGQTTAPAHKLRDNAEKFEFKAEVNRLLDIIIHSLYSNKDVFLRELISNASDALDKIRFLSLTDKSVLGEGDAAKLEMQIKVDKDKKLITLRDRGIGMTAEDLKNNLGTIAKSGTSAFLEKLQKGGDVNLIGQFGVGFYSVYLIADYVEVITKHNDDKQYIWESSADGNFAISEDTENEALDRGTQINIYVKDECQEYLDENKLKELVHKYSEFINFPIYLWGSKEVEKEVPVEEEEKTEEASEEKDTEEVKEDEKEEEKDDKDDDIEDDDDEEAEEEKPKTKKVTETVQDWELLNDSKALWLRSASEIEEEEYKKFYKAISKNFDDPLIYNHFRGEGDVEFKAILFIPEKAPHDMYDSYYNKKPKVKLYVRRVFISDDMEELLPKYLNFLAGVVDSDTLPLNVSREMLQQEAALKTIRKKLVRKALDMLKKLADAEKRMRELDDKQDDKEDDEDVKKIKEEGAKFAKFWEEFGKAIKLGITEDSTNRNRLAKLLRFHTSQYEDKLTSLDEYITRMKPSQKEIFYLTGSSKDEVSKSPLVERLKAKGYEVIYFSEPVDEYVMQNLMEYEDKKFANVAKDDLKIDDKQSKKAFKAVKEEYKKMVDWWKSAITDPMIESVKVSNRLATTPCVVVTSKYGWTASMERIMRAQALGTADKQTYMRARRILEINPRHPLIQELKVKFDADKDDASAKAVANVLYDTALLESGFLLEDTKSFNKRVYELLKDTMKIEKDLDDIEPEAEVEEATEESKDAEETKEESAETEDSSSEGKDEL